MEFDSVPFPGSYWIVKLGPVENNQYQYSVVTDRFGLTLFILVSIKGLVSDVCVHVCCWRPLRERGMDRMVPMLAGLGPGRVVGWGGVGLVTAPHAALDSGARPPQTIAN